MELKTKYQYTYFIYPYEIKQTKYNEYIKQILKNKKFKVIFWNQQKNIELYTHFLPTIKKCLFQNFEFNQEKIKNFEHFNIYMQSTALSKEYCTMFEYNIEEQIQGKNGESNGIFFKIQRIKLICFNTGICFLLIKTNIEDSTKFSDVIDFNYKFRDINSNLKNLKQFENIKLQSNTFSDVKNLNEFIEEIIGKKVVTKDLDIDLNRFLTFSYVCIEEDNWNSEKKFSNIESEYLKYANILPSSYKSNFSKDSLEIVSKWDYIKIGIIKSGVMLICSGIDTYNYTKLPVTFENEYLYTYILTLYEKIYLKRLEKELKQKGQEKRLRKEFIDFTKDIWIQEITNDDIGSILYEKLKKVCELNKIYEYIKDKYDLVYKELNIDKQIKINKFISIALIISLVINIINFIILMRLK